MAGSGMSGFRGMGGFPRSRRLWFYVVAGFAATAALAAVTVVTPYASIVVIGVFWAAIVVGMVVRLLRARPGARIRSAFGPVMSAAEEYQRLYTTQAGLGASLEYAIREQENGAETPGGEKR